MSKSARFIFHNSLNDFLLRSERNKPVLYYFNDVPAIKHPIEIIGVPHPEVNMILVNNTPVDLFYSLQDKDEVEVYPVDHTYKFSAAWSLTKHFPLPKRFILDVNLGKLARILRLSGFDASYENDYTDKRIAEIAETEKRIVLTRDVNLLKQKTVVYGYWLRSQFPEEQSIEVLKRFDLAGTIRPFERCVECNGKIKTVAKESVLDKLLPKTILYYDHFFQCEDCRRIYWRGSHYEYMKQFIEKIKRACE